MSDSNVSIKEFKKVPPGCTVILGFPGTGMAGSISSEFIIHKKDFEQVGHIRSPKLPAVAIVRRSKPQAPVRIYHKGKTVMVVADVMIPDNLCHDFAEVLVKWIKLQKPKEVIILGGIENKDQKHKNYVVSWKAKYLDTIKLDHMKLGFVVGIYGPLMMELMENNLPGYLILTEAQRGPDPKAAAVIVRHVAERIKMQIDPSSLEKEAEKKLGTPKVEGKSWDPYPSIYG
ncbi:MAG: proteasome assembly chaperone family protein [Candidatus Altiarchaeota archaeon]|nr:proteasome assembly chaperone family protein [Candidatus Altiarchaeota archaeon]